MDCRCYLDFKAILCHTDFIESATDDEIERFLVAISECENITSAEYRSLYETVMKKISIL